MVFAIGITIVLLAIGIGLYLSMRGTTMDVQEWSVGGRRFGTFIFWFLLVGETFTTFALLGATQGIVTGGSPGYYIFGTVVLTASIGYFVVPRIWMAGKRYNFTTMGDFFAARFDAKWFGAVITVFGIIAILLYARVQLTGLALILQALVGIDASSIIYVALAGVAILFFVMIGGMRSSAFVGIIKDILLVVALLIITVGAVHAADAESLGGIFESVKAKHPDAAVLPGIGGGAETSIWWWMSFLLLTPLGAFVLPHSFQVSYTADGPKTIRKNQILQPLYSLFYVFIAIIGLAALVTLPTLSPEEANGALLYFTEQNYPGWVTGVLVGAGVLTALVPTGVIVVTAASMFRSNILAYIKPELKESLGANRVSVVVFTALAVLITALQSDALLSIMTSVYSAVGQLAPALFLGMLWRRATAPGVTAGLVAGGLIVAVPAISGALLTVFPQGTVSGIPALAVNIVITVVVSLLTSPPKQEAIDVGMGLNRPFKTKTATQ
jgi:SSS family solute:Na+ symporter